ncbi:MAG: hypothetical protein HQK94_19190 [Nitrospirae bacterium]|nr:hypothetical protein [Nitrospirota bacterium]
MGIPEIRNLLRDIIEMLNVNQVMILLDEWQGLNDCQSEFAEQLKSCFYGIDCISIKIAAYRNICSFNNGATRPNFRGLEINQDIFVVGDVDLPPATEDTLKFFFKMLYRRLIYKVPELESYYGSLDLFDYNQLIIDIFKNSRAAEMLARGSHGVSRDFIEGFNYASNLVSNDVARDKITLDHVQQAHSALSRNIRQNIQTADDIGGLLFEVIKPQVHRTKVPYFFISRQQSEWNDLLLELVEKRALHIIRPTDMPKNADSEWIGYEVSYGLFADWQRALLFSNKASCDSFDWTDIKDRTFNSEDFNFFVLRLDESPRTLRLCEHCKKQFSTASRPFIKARCCPHCYKEQPKIEESS